MQKTIIELLTTRGQSSREFCFTDHYDDSQSKDNQTRHYDSKNWKVKKSPIRVKSNNQDNLYYMNTRYLRFILSFLTLVALNNYFVFLRKTELPALPFGQKCLTNLNKKYHITINNGCYQTCVKEHLYDWTEPKMFQLNSGVYCMSLVQVWLYLKSFWNIARNEKDICNLTLPQKISLPGAR